MRQQNALTRKFLVPLLKERLGMEESYKSQSKEAHWEKDKIADGLQWMLDSAPENEKGDLNMLAMRLMNLNLTAVNTSNFTFTDIMFYLCKHPEIHEKLRLETEEVLEEDKCLKKQI
jgi:hypothetical protein